MKIFNSLIYQHYNLGIVDIFKKKFKYEQCTTKLTLYDDLIKHMHHELDAHVIKFSDNF